MFKESALIPQTPEAATETEISLSPDSAEASAREVAQELGIDTEQQTPEELPSMIEKRIAEKPGILDRVRRPVSVLLALGIITIADGLVNKLLAGDSTKAKGQTEQGYGTWNDYVKQQHQEWQDYTNQQAQEFQGQVKQQEKEFDKFKNQGSEKSKEGAHVLTTAELKDFLSHVKVEGDQKQFADMVKDLDNVVITPERIFIVTACTSDEVNKDMAVNPGHLEYLTHTTADIRADLKVVEKLKTNQGPTGKFEAASFSGWEGKTFWVVSGYVYNNPGK